MSEIIRGRLLAQKVKEKASQKISKMKQPPGLAVILVGSDPASQLYVSLKEKAAKAVGIYFEKYLYEEDVQIKELIRRIHELNKREDIHGILVQLPLPGQDEDAVIAAIDPLKDIDGFHPINRMKLKQGEPGLVPPVSLAIMKLIESTHQPLRGKIAVVVGNNPVFSEPLVELMKDAGIAGSFLPRISSAIEAKLRVVDIVVIAIGEAGFLTKDMVKEGSIIIDVGTNKIEGKTIGDVHANVFGSAGFISPVPGGVGPLTVAFLLMNVIRAEMLQAEERARGTIAG